MGGDKRPSQLADVTIAGRTDLGSMTWPDPGLQELQEEQAQTKATGGAARQRVERILRPKSAGAAEPATNVHAVQQEPERAELPLTGSSSPKNGQELPICGANDCSPVDADAGERPTK